MLRFFLNYHLITTVIWDRNHGGSESDSDSGKSLTVLCGEPIYPGDMIFYYHEAFGARPI
jgi:hypothetical protein